MHQVPVRPELLAAAGASVVFERVVVFDTAPDGAAAGTPDDELPAYFDCEKK